MLELFEVIALLDWELIALELLGIGDGEGGVDESLPQAANSNDDEKIANAEIFFMEEYL